MTTTLIVTGTRHATQENRDVIADELDQFADFLGVQEGEKVRMVHGAARGFDRIADSIAAEWGWEPVPVPAKWPECGEGCPKEPHRRIGKTGEYCPEAGPRRSRLMVDTYGAEAAGVLAMPEKGGGPFTGTWQCALYATNAGLYVAVKALAVVVPETRKPRPAWLRNKHHQPTLQAA